ncbi:DUF1516 family protein [Periweissella cryptocerci]|nr:DUF1516 family protein [Periweissella cryptocerci]
MPITLLLHLICAMLLLVVSILIIFARTNKRLKVLVTVNRALYLVLFVTGGLLAFDAFPHHWFLATLKIILAIALVGGLEVLAAYKAQIKVSWRLLILILVLFVAVFAVGFLLHFGV